MTDSEVGCKTFEAALHRKPDRKEFARLLERRLYYLHQTFAESEHYRVLPGVEELLPKLIDDGHLLGLVTGNLEAVVDGGVGSPEDGDDCRTRLGKLRESRPADRGGEQAPLASLARARAARRAPVP
jgi:hypothetical protein